MGNVSQLGQEPEDLWKVPRGRIKNGGESFGKDSWDVFQQSSASNVCHALDQAALCQRHTGLDVQASGNQERLSQGLVGLGRGEGRRRLVINPVFLDQVADQRETV